MFSITTFTTAKNDNLCDDNLKAKPQDVILDSYDGELSFNLKNFEFIFSKKKKAANTFFII